MNIELNNATENEVEFVEKEVQRPSNKFEKLKVFIFLSCLIFAFIGWCYAHYLDDPIVLVDKDIECVWVDASGRGLQVEITDMEGNVIDKLPVYAEKSVIYSVDSITIELKKSDFENSDTKVIDIKFPDDVHSHTTQVVVRLISEEK